MTMLAAFFNKPSTGNQFLDEFVDFLACAVSRHIAVPFAVDCIESLTARPAFFVKLGEIVRIHFSAQL